MTEYPDSNHDGVPDAFENRPSITEILNSQPVGEPSATVVVEVETVIRSANAGEWVFTTQGFEQCRTYDHNRYRGYVVRRFLG